MNNAQNPENVETVTPENVETVTPENEGRHGKHQYKTMSTLKRNEHTGTETLVFSFTFLIVEVTCLVIIPCADTDTAPVYIKFKIR